MKTIEWKEISTRKIIRGDTKGIFYAMMGTTKDRNGKDLIEADY